MNLLLQMRVAFPNEISGLFERLSEITVASEKGWECSEILPSPHEVENKEDKINSLQFLGSNTCSLSFGGEQSVSCVGFQFIPIKHIPGWQTRSRELHQSPGMLLQALTLGRKTQNVQIWAQLQFHEFNHDKTQEIPQNWNQDWNLDWNHLHPWLFPGKKPLLFQPIPVRQIPECPAQTSRFWWSWVWPASRRLDEGKTQFLSSASSQEVLEKMKTKEKLGWSADGISAL